MSTFKEKGYRISPKVCHHGKKSSNESQALKSTEKQTFGSPFLAERKDCSCI